VLTLYTGYYPLCGVIGVALLWNAWATRERGDALRFALGFAVAAIR